MSETFPYIRLISLRHKGSWPDAEGAGAAMSVRVERNGPVTTIILDRPERRNAVDGPAAHALAEAMRAFDADPDARAAVLTGAGGTFCAGADLKAIGGPEGNRLAPDGDAPMGLSRLRLSKPVIAALGGYAVAGGLELALRCDVRVVEDTAANRATWAGSGSELDRATGGGCRGVADGPGHARCRARRGTPRRRAARARARGLPARVPTIRPARDTRGNGA